MIRFDAHKQCINHTFRVALLLGFSLACNFSWACLSCPPIEPALKYEPNAAIFNIAGFDPSGLSVKAMLDIDAEGKVTRVKIVSASMEDVPKKLLIRSIEQAEFEPSVDKNCLGLEVLDFEFYYAY